MTSKTRLKLLIFLPIFLFMSVCLGIQAFVYCAVNASFEGEFVINKNEIEVVEVDCEKYELKVGEQTKLSVFAYPLPANQTLENIEYRIISGSNYATINKNILTVNKDAVVGKSIVVDAVVDGIVSRNQREIKIVKTPVEQLDIICDKNVLNEGESVKLDVNCSPIDATYQNVIYSIIDGSEYATILLDGTLIVNSNLPRGDIKITVRAKSLYENDVFVDKTFDLYKPVKELVVANSDLLEVEQDRQYLFSAKCQPSFATLANQSLTYSVDVGSNVATIDGNGKLSVNKFAPMGSKITITISGPDGVFAQKTVTVVPVFATGIKITNVSPFTYGDKFLPGNKVAVEVEFLGQNNITKSNKNYLVKLDNNDVARVENNMVIINSIDNILIDNPHFTLHVVSNQNGVEISDSIEIYVYIPVEQVELTRRVDSLNEGEIYNLNDLVDVKILPNNAENKNVNFALINEDNATIFNNRLFVNSNLPSGNEKLQIVAIIDNVVSSAIEFNLYKPVKAINLPNADLTQVEQNRRYSFCANVEPYNATFGNNPVSYSVNVGEDVATIDGNGTLIISPTAPIGTDITIRIDATDSVYIEQTVTVVPVFASGITITRVSDPTHGNKYLPGDVISVKASVYGADNITESNKDYYVEVSNTNIARVEGNNVVINPVESISEKFPHFTIFVCSNQNGLVLKDSYEVYVYIPVTNVVLTQKQTTLVQGLTYFYADLFEVEVLPSNSEINDVNYFAVGESYMDVKIDELVVDGDLACGNLKIQLQAKSENVVSNVLTFDLYKPVEDLYISNKNLTEVEQNRNYDFGAIAMPTTATNIGVKYAIDVEEDVATIDKNGLLSISKSAPIGAQITVRIDAEDQVYFETTLTVVPVYATGIKITEISASTHGEKYLPNDIISVEASVYGADNITESNKAFYLQVSDNSIAKVQNNKVVISSIDKILVDNPHFTIFVCSNQNGKIIKDSVEIYVYVPVKQVVLTKKYQTLEQGKLYYLSNLLSVEVLPKNNQEKSISYFVDDRNLATIENGKILVNNNLASGNLQVKVYAVCDGVESQPIAFDLYKPTNNIIISSQNCPKSFESYGEYVSFKVKVDDTASKFNPSVYVVDGAENLDGNYKDGDKLALQTNGDNAGLEAIFNCVKVKKNLAMSQNLDKHIRLKAIQDGAVAYVDIYLYIPNEKIVFNKNTLTRGANKFSVNFTQNADDISWKIISYSDGIESASTNGTIVVKNNVIAGTNLQIVCETADNIQNVIDFTTDGLQDIQGSMVFVNQVEVIYTKHFNIFVNKDNSGVSILRSTSQIHVGRNISFQVKYGNCDLSEYGFKLGSVVALSNNITSDFEGDYGKISVLSTAKGKEAISFAITIIDGNKTYTVNFNNSFYVFRPISGWVKISNRLITSIETDLELVASTNFDQYANYGVSDFIFEGYSANKSSVTSSGHLTLYADTSSLDQDFKVSCNQSYNGTTITFTQNVDAVLFTRTVHTHDDKSSVFTCIAIDGFDNIIQTPTKTGYVFEGYIVESGYFGDEYIDKLYYDEDGVIINDHSSYTSLYMSKPILSVLTLGGKWRPISYLVDLYVHINNPSTTYCCNPLSKTFYYDQEDTFTDTLWSSDQFTYEYTCFNASGKMLECTFTDSKYFFKVLNFTTEDGSSVGITTYYTEQSCVASGTMITLADGSQKAVEKLTGDELLLVWNLETGDFDCSPITFIDTHGERDYLVTKLYFEDGTIVKVISEHGFWDCEQAKYVYITSSNAEQFVGHYFDKEYIDANGKLNHKQVKLIKTENVVEYTNSWSPVTYKHLCYYVDGMLSVPSETQGFTNIFDVDKNTMQYNLEKMNKDIELYGLFVYEIDFAEFMPEEIFEAFNGKYLKVSILKGYLTEEQIMYMLEKNAKHLLEVD